MQPRFHLSHPFMFNSNLGNPSSLCTIRSLSMNPYSSWFKVEVAAGSQKNNNNKAFDAVAFEAEAQPWWKLPTLPGTKKRKVEEMGN